MDNPDTYKKSSSFRDDDHQRLLDEFAPKFNWRSDGKDSVIDIGCAGGNVTTEIILPKMPKDFSRLLGVDINANMVDYARKNYKIPKVSFDKLDIGGDITEFMQKNDPFDHVLSFLCLQLVPDQKKAMENILKLTKTNGDCFLYFLEEFSGYDVYRKLFPKWSEYMFDIDDFVSQYYHRINPVGMLKKHLRNAGFLEFEVCERTKTVVYHDVQKFQDAFKPIFSFFSRIPAEKQGEFLQDYTKLSMEAKLDEKIDMEKPTNSENINIFVQYKFLIAFARK